MFFNERKHGRHHVNHLYKSKEGGHHQFLCVSERVCVCMRVCMIMCVCSLGHNVK